MNPNATITDEQFEAYLAQIRALVEGPFEELQKEVEVTNAFPDEFYELARENDLYRFYLPACYGGWNLSELEILRVQEEFSRGPGGMRMHLHHAADMNWRILDDYGKPELKARHMQRFQDKGVYCNFAITEQTGGTGADIHATALKQPDGTYLLNGEKWLISHTDCSDFTYVIAVTDPATVERLSQLNAQVMGREGDPFYGAKTVVVVLVDRSVPTHLEDGSLAMGNLPNAAYALGVDSCWIHRAHEVFDSPEGLELLASSGLSAHGSLRGVGNCILGYAEGPPPEAKPRRENVVYVPPF